MKENLLRDFEDIFKSRNGVEMFFAPGRVNLIGEHTDNYGGHVFPCALTFGTYAVARRIDEPVVRLYSKNFDDNGIIEFGLDELKYEEEHDWANYPKGVIWTFKKNNYPVNSGIEVLYYGNIPNGAGLSSSASIEVVTAVLLKSLFKLSVDMIEMIKLSKYAENNFIGVNCGIMDQFAIGMGKKNHAVLLDTNTLEYEYVGIELDGASIVIANTNKRRGLSDSKYNERRSQCDEALKDLQKKLDISALGELNEEQFGANRYLIINEINAKRAKHAVYENRRALRAVEALKLNDIKTFGRLMNESHVSLRDDYEVTGVELDTLVELAWRQEGVIGSRMTGAGFGGCTVSIVKNEYIDDFIKDIGTKYAEKIGYEASFYIAQVGDGAGKI
jgi:galactokinase